jgi:hypothetical protein
MAGAARAAKAVGASQPALRERPRRLRRAISPAARPPTVHMSTTVSRRLRGSHSLRRRDGSRVSTGRLERPENPERPGSPESPESPGSPGSPASLESRARRPLVTKRLRRHSRISSRHLLRKATLRARPSPTWSGRRLRPTGPPQAVATAGRRNRQDRLVSGSAAAKGLPAPHPARMAWQPSRSWTHAARGWRRRCSMSPLEAASIRSNTSSNPLVPP